MMEGMDVERFLYDALADARSTTPMDVQASLGSDGEIDSLEGVELVAAAEERFGIKIEDDEVTSRVCRSIPGLAALVQTKLRNG